MAVLKYLQSAEKGGNPIYILDLTTMAYQIALSIMLTSRRNSFNAATGNVVDDIAILAGFDTTEDGKITPGYLYFKGYVYGFASNDPLDVGGYLVATKVQTDVRSTKTGSDFYAYISCELSISQSIPSDADSMVGPFTLANIKAWKTRSLSSEGLVIPNNAITHSMLAPQSVSNTNLSPQSVSMDKLGQDVRLAINQATLTPQIFDVSDNLRLTSLSTKMWSVMFSWDIPSNWHIDAHAWSSVSLGNFASAEGFSGFLQFLTRNEYFTKLGKYESPTFSFRNGAVSLRYLLQILSGGDVYIVVNNDSDINVEAGLLSEFLSLHDTLIGQ